MTETWYLIREAAAKQQFPFLCNTHQPHSSAQVDNPTFSLCPLNQLSESSALRHQPGILHNPWILPITWDFVCDISDISHRYWSSSRSVHIQQVSHFVWPSGFSAKAEVLTSLLKNMALWLDCCEANMLQKVMSALHFGPHQSLKDAWSHSLLKVYIFTVLVENLILRGGSTGITT